jgi:tRNA-splicing ligase RtcB
MLFSTVHGAGRVLGRAAAKKGAAILDDNGIPTGKRDLSTMVTQDMMNEWVKKVGIQLRGGGVDESPHVYRRLPDVLKAQGDTIQVLTTLTPLIVVMAGKNEYDPYRD